MKMMHLSEDMKETLLKCLNMVKWPGNRSSLSISTKKTGSLNIKMVLMPFSTKTLMPVRSKITSKYLHDLQCWAGIHKTC